MSLRFNQLTMYTTNDCNLACTYCFLPKEKRDAKPRVLREVLDMFFREYAEEPVRIRLFGTEPLLRWKLTKLVIEYTEKLADEYGYRYNTGITTNGVLLNKKRITYLTEHKVGLLCSIDGSKEIHDKYRVFPDGRGSYDIVARNFKRWLKYNPYSPAAFTLVPEAIPRLERHIDALFQLGFKIVMLNKSLYPGPRYSSEELELLYLKLVTDVVDLIERKVDNATSVWIGFLTNYLWRRYRGKERKNKETTCGAGKKGIAADIDGNFYVCHQAVHYPRFRIGDYKKGIDEKKVRKWRSRRHIQCLYCPVPNCSPCDIRNYLQYGDVGINDPISCMYNIVVWRASLAAEQRLKNEGYYTEYMRGLEELKRCVRGE